MNSGLIIITINGVDKPRYMMLQTLQVSSHQAEQLWLAVHVYKSNIQNFNLKYLY